MTSLFDDYYFFIRSCFIPLTIDRRPRQVVFYHARKPLRFSQITLIYVYTEKENITLLRKVNAAETTKDRSRVTAIEAQILL